MPTEEPHEALVYDLDGTLVRLAVDWEAVTAEGVELFAEVGVDASGRTLWDLLDLAEEHRLGGELEAVIARHERDGAERAERLPLADAIVGETRPVGVCSLNAETACRLALETHGLADHVDVVVGRDSVPTRKPHPEPLLTTIERLNSTPERALFVGDSERDAEAAERAGVAFRYAGDGPSGH